MLRNGVNLIGRTTRDPDVTMAGETKIARFTMAIDRQKRNNDTETKTDFIDCVAFGKTADTIEKYIHKGNKLGVYGTLQMSEYESKRFHDGDGNPMRIRRYEVVVNNMEFLEARPKDNAEQNTAPSNHPANSTTNPPSNYTTVADEGAELPF